MSSSSTSVTADSRYGCSKCKAVFRTGFARCPIDGEPLQALMTDPLEGSPFTDRYVIEEFVGEGAMGRVYRARHQRVSRQFAIKVLFGDHTTDPKMRERFAREAEAASRLQHPNVISVVDFGECDSLLYLVMDFVEGPELDEVINEEAPLDPTRAERLLRGLCLGLEHAHAEGLVHRDFKGANVILSDRRGGETPRIVDFGLAVMSELVDADRITTEGIVFGTPAYMSPEQATGQEIDHLTDLFALGVVLYEMLCGVGPFEGSPIEIARQNITSEPPRIADRVPGLRVEPTLEAIALKLMAKKKVDRFQSAAEVIEALDRGGAVQSVQVTEVAPAQTLAELEERDDSEAIEPQRTPLLGMVIAGLLALIVLGGAAALMIRTITEGESEPEPGPVAAATPDAAPTPDAAAVSPEPPALDAAPAIAPPVDAAPAGKPAPTPDATPVAKPDPRPDPRPDPKPDRKPDPPAPSKETLTRLYLEVNRALHAYENRNGGAAAGPLWTRYNKLSIQDAIAKPAIGVETFRELEALRQRAREGR